jgi:aromatic ring-opening dioxygenase catalytic subunit (LigB family)
MSSARLPTYFVSHGGGPWPYMKDELGSVFDELEASIVGIRRELATPPRAILVVTGHWESPEFAVSTARNPTMLYDYHGFPAHTYRVQYKAPGSPEVAQRVRALLEAGGIPCRGDEQRGFDHGTFTLMEPLYPEADIPVVQLSLRDDYLPGAHIEAGRLLAPLRDEGVLILGSGLSYHNLRRMDQSGAAPSKQFDDWLQRTLVGSSSHERRRGLIEWATAPAARIAHPSEDHLLPLMVAAGAAHDDTGSCIYHEERFMGAVTVSSFGFGRPASHLDGTADSAVED